VHNVSQWTNLRHLAERLGGAVNLLEAGSFKQATKSMQRWNCVLEESVCLSTYYKYGQVQLWNVDAVKLLVGIQILFTSRCNVGRGNCQHWFHVVVMVWRVLHVMLRLAARKSALAHTREKLCQTQSQLRQQT